MELLSDQKSNTKMAKTVERSWYLALAPADSSGYNVCPWSTNGCRTACVAYAGLNQVWESIHQARVRKTRWFFEERQSFLERLWRELRNKDRWCAKKDMFGYIRLNTFSDIDWKRTLPKITELQSIRFYDYTKSIKKATEYLYDINSNYRLIYSYNESSDPKAVRELLESGGTVAVVRADIKYVNSSNMGTIPDTITIDGKQFKTFDADVQDNRYIDPPGCIGVLRLKGTPSMRKHAIETGFAMGTPYTQLTIKRK